MNRSHDPSVSGTRAMLTRIALVLIALLGAAMIYMGSRGVTAHTDSGFSDASAFKATYALSGVTADAWNKTLKPDLEALSADEREALDTAALSLLEEAWGRKSDAGAAEAARIVAEAGDSDPGLRYRLLYATYLPNESPASVPRTKREAIESIPAAEAAAFRQAVMRGILDETAELPEAARAAAEGKSGSQRQAVLMQAVFVSGGSQRGEVSETVSDLKKGVRDPAMQIRAYEMIARGEISWLWQFIVHNARTVVLIGILLILDAALLALLMAWEHRWRFDFKWVLILLIVDFLLYFLLMPMIYMVVQAFTENGVFTLNRIRRVYENPDNLTALKNTLIASGATMVLGTVLAFPLAWLVGRTNLIGKKFFRSLFVLSYMVPPYVGAMAWTFLLNPTAGPVNQTLRSLFGLGGTSGPLNIYTLPGLIWVLTTFYYPYAFITISRAMEKMDPSLEEASRISGASPVGTVLRITLPIMTPSLIAGALLVFISAASCYGIPSIVASGTNGLQTVTTRIKFIQGIGQDGMNDATGLSVFLMAVALLILFLSDVVLARRQYVTVSGKSTQPAMVDLRRWRIPLTVLVSLFAALVVFLPFGTILTISLRSDLGKGLLEPGNFTLNAWKIAFGENATLACLKNSVVFAAVAATIGIVIACVMSHLLQRTQIRGRSIPNFLITLGSGTPSVVIALGLIMTMKGDFGLALTATPAIVVVAYLVKYLMMGMRTVSSAMSQIHVSLEESSQIAGASWQRTMMRITGPLILPSIAAGWLLIFIPCFYELSMSVLLTASTTKTIGVQLFDYWTIHSQPVGSAMAFGILMMVVVLNFLLNRLTKGKFSI